MKKKCDKCGKPAKFHLTDIVNGQKIEKDLCEDCAAEEGITVKTNVPISQLLEDFVLTASQQQQAEQPPRDLECEVCGMTFSEFREHGSLGCPNDYDAFDRILTPMIARAHDGATQHVGKVPHHADQAQARQNRILRLRADLKVAIQTENYERAAELRDRIKHIEAEA